MQDSISKAVFGVKVVTYIKIRYGFKINGLQYYLHGSYVVIYLSYLWLVTLWDNNDVSLVRLWHAIQKIILKLKTFIF